MKIYKRKKRNNIVPKNWENELRDKTQEFCMIYSLIVVDKDLNVIKNNNTKKLVILKGNPLKTGVKHQRPVLNYEGKEQKKVNGRNQSKRKHSLKNSSSQRNSIKGTKGHKSNSSVKLSQHKYYGNLLSPQNLSLKSQNLKKAQDLGHKNNHELGSALSNGVISPFKKSKILILISSRIKPRA